MRTKRIADFIESIPESAIESSTILFGGAADKPSKPTSATNRNHCKNTALDSCKRSTNYGNCRNFYDMCIDSLNHGKCHNGDEM